jgi:hypothetical protein
MDIKKAIEKFTMSKPKCQMNVKIQKFLNLGFGFDLAFELWHLSF